MNAPFVRSSVRSRPLGIIKELSMTCQMAVLVNEGESEEAKSPLERAQRNTADVTHRSFLSAHAHALAISDNISPIQI